MHALHIAGATPGAEAALGHSDRLEAEIERELIRGREFDFGRRFLPDALSKLGELDFLGDDERRLLSQVQGRTYANMACLFERLMGIKMALIDAEPSSGPDAASDTGERRTQDQLKQFAMFQRVGRMIGAGMPGGYRFLPDPRTLARELLGAQRWAVLALALQTELCTQVHGLWSLESDGEHSELFWELFQRHWTRQSRRALGDEAAWRREDASLTPVQRDQGVADFVTLLALVDGLVQVQAVADARYFLYLRGRGLAQAPTRALVALLRSAYRWQHLLSGHKAARFADVLGPMVGADGLRRIAAALTPPAD